MKTKRNDTHTPKRYTEYKAVASAPKEWAIGPNNEPLRHMKHGLLKSQFCSVQFSRTVVSDSLQHQELQHARPPCPSPLPEFTQTHVHRVSDAIQPSHPLSAPSPPASNPSQHQSLFQWVNSSREAAKVLDFQLQHQSFQWTPSTDLL